MGGSSGEEQSKKKRSESGDDSCNFCGRTKRTMSPIYSRSISFPSSSARPRPSPSPFLCRSKSDISPPSSFPFLWTHTSSPTTAPNLATPPAPAPAASPPPPPAMISPEKETSPWGKSNKSSVSPPPAAAGNASPVADLSPDPSAEKWRRMTVEQPRKVRRKIDTNSPAGDASQEDATAGSADGGELATKGETLKISFSCSCGRTVACNIDLI